MKTKIRQRMIAMALAGMMIAAPVSGSVYAADEAIAEQAQPVAAVEVKEEVKEEAKVEIKEEAKEIKAEIPEQKKEEAAEVKAVEASASQEVKTAEEAKIELAAPEAEVQKEEKAEAAAEEQAVAEEDDLSDVVCGDEVSTQLTVHVTNILWNRYVKIMRNGADVSEYYDITTENGLLSVKAAPAPAAKTDNGTPAAPKNRPAGPAARTADNQAAAEIVEQGTPMAAPEAVIADSAAPLAANGAWALLNLIMTVITGIISAVLLTGYFGKKEDEEDDNEDAETKRKGLVRLASIIPAAGAIIAFILTEDMSLQMALTDRWTILMAVILLIQAVTAMFAKKEKEENEETAEAIN